MSEQSAYPRSQGSLGEISVESAALPFTSLSQAENEKEVRYKPKFAEFACSHVEVCFCLLPARTTHILTCVGFSLRSSDNI